MSLFRLGVDSDRIPGHAVAVGSPAADDRCPDCAGELRPLGFLLCLRAEDQKRVCRAPMWCLTCDRVWTRWADRPGPLELDEWMPDSLKRSLLGQDHRSARRTRR
jgi:hypothetical protein